MSKRCTYCGSYNTEMAVGNCAERVAVNAGRVLISLGGGLLGSAFHPGMGGAFAYKIWVGTKQGDLLSHHCCKCGRDF